MLSNSCCTISQELADKENIPTRKNIPQCTLQLPAYFIDLKKHEIILDLEEAFYDHYIDEKMRAQIIDWIFEVIQAYKASYRTFQLSIKIMDIYCTRVKRLLPLEYYHIAVTSILLAFKYEEIKPISMSSLCDKVSHGIIEKDQLKIYEKKILAALNYNLYIPTLYDFCEILFEERTDDEKFQGEFLYNICTINMQLVSRSASKLAEAIFLSVTKLNTPTQGPLALCIQELNSLKESLNLSTFKAFSSKYQVFFN